MNVVLLTGGMLVLVAVSIAVVAAVVAVVWAVSRRGGGLRVEPSGPMPAVPRAVPRRCGRYRLAGVAVGLVAAAGVTLCSRASWLGLDLAAAPAVFAWCVLAGVLAGELTATAPEGGVRRAVLEVRAVAHYLPRTLTAITVGLAAVLAVLLAGAASVGAEDELGRPGRRLVLRCPPAADGASVSSAGPWPGLYYGLPIGLGVLVALAGAAVALRVIVRRARLGTDPATRVADDGLRRRSARAVVCACGFLSAMSLAGAALVAGAAAKSAGRGCHEELVVLGGWVGTGLAAVSTVLACVFAVALLTPPNLTPLRRVEPQTGIHG